MEFSRQHMMLLQKSCLHASRLAAVCAGAHHASGSKCHVGGAYNSAGQEKIFNIPAVIAAIRYLKNSLAVPLVAAWSFAENAVRRMQVHRPSAEGHGVGMFSLFHDVLLFQNVIAFKPSAFAFAGNCAHPF